TFGLKGGYDAGVRLVSNVKLFSHLANIGDTRSLIIHPASTTHRQLTDAQKIQAGAGPDVVRLSIGLEDKDDIIADLEQGLAAPLAHSQRPAHDREAPPTRRDRGPSSGQLLRWASRSRRQRSPRQKIAARCATHDLDGSGRKRNSDEELGHSDAAAIAGHYAPVGSAREHTPARQ